jgi:hypothetical protein
VVALGGALRLFSFLSVGSGWIETAFASLAGIRRKPAPILDRKTFTFSLLLFSGHIQVPH